MLSTYIRSRMSPLRVDFIARIANDDLPGARKPPGFGVKASRQTDKVPFPALIPPDDFAGLAAMGARKGDAGLGHVRT